MLEHFVNVCSCGAILSQCRCPGEGKAVRTYPRACGECRKTPAAKPVKVKRLPRWTCPLLEGVMVEARARSEARAKFKDILGLERLPDGIGVEQHTPMKEAV